MYFMYHLVPTFVSALDKVKIIFVSLFKTLVFE